VRYVKLKKQETDKCGKYPMSRFKDLDSKLEEWSKRLNARLTKDRSGYPEALRTFEERRIDWESDAIRRAIIIQPTFEFSGVDSTRWNFVNVAWKDEGGARRRYMHKLVDQKDFTVIAEHIDELLTESVKTLTNIADKDLT
jgi:hypothetical protein